jgi:hypothetical protein
MPNSITIFNKSKNRLVRYEKIITVEDGIRLEIMNNFIKKYYPKADGAFSEIRWIDIKGINTPFIVTINYLNGK